MKSKKTPHNQNQIEKLHKEAKLIFLTQIYHTVGTVPKSNIKIVERGKFTKGGGFGP
jgi:hypothetical protein